MVAARPAGLGGSVRIPTSKPHTQRALLMAALAGGESVIRRPNLCSESELLRDACTALGADVAADGDNLIVRGFGGKPRTPAAVLRVAGSGFALRHLLPVAALADGPCVLTGDRRLAARPFGPLLDALRTLGCRAEPADEDLLLPVITWGTGIAGGQVEVPATETSQFVSALLLAAPYAAQPVRVRVPGPVVSHHYIRMTCEMMARFGGEVSAAADLSAIDVRPVPYQSRSMAVGPDVTSLFYFVAAAVVTTADILVEDVTLAGDAFLDRAVTLGRQLGVRISQEGPAIRICSGPPPAARVEVDAADIPTLVPALAALASSLAAGMRLRNARHVQFHKTSRLQVVMAELALMGRALRPLYQDGQLDGFETAGTGQPAAAEVDSHGDHRNFMALYIAALAVPAPVRVRGAETLSTSFADFEQSFRALSAAPARA